jgi:nicotinamidase-related amidase
MEQNTALLVMDMQTLVLGNFPDTTELLNHTARAIAHARSKKIPVIYVVVGFRNGMPEINPNNKSFAAAKQRFAGLDMNDFVKIEPALAPLPGELVVTKRRISAYAGSDLEIILRSFGIEHLVLSGISTSGVVLSTLRESADKDYRLTLLSDCCADAEEEVHRVLTTRIFPRHAEVLSEAAWTAL